MPEVRDWQTVADPRDAASDGPREKERSIVLGEDDVERFLRLAEAAQLRLEHIDVDIGRGEDDGANPADWRQVARNLDLAERLDGDPIAHGMRQHIDLFGIAAKQETQRVLEAVAGGGRTVQVID